MFSDVNDVYEYQPCMGPRLCSILFIKRKPFLLHLLRHCLINNHQVNKQPGLNKKNASMCLNAFGAHALGRMGTTN